MIRVVVSGSECTGKTTLTRDLAEMYQSPWAPEFVREFVESLGRVPNYGDVPAIARGQIALEDEVTPAEGRLLLLDTDLVSTYVYSHHYYGKCPSWIGRAVDDRRADLYLLAGIDIPWTPDGQQRDRGDRREEMQGLFRDELARRRFHYVEIRGSREERLRLARLAIDDLLG